MAISKKDFWDPNKMGATVDVEKSNPLKSAVNMAHNGVKATVEGVANYVGDVIDPAYEGLKSLLTMPLVFGKNGWKSMPKGFANFFINELTAVKNASLGLVGLGNNAYKHGIQDNVVEITNGTTDRIPFIGGFLGNVVKAVPSTIGLIPDMLNWALKGIDSFVDKANTYTSLEGRSLPKVRLRLA